MKPTIKGDQTFVAKEDLDKLLPRPLSDRDKGAFWLHVTEIENMGKKDFPKEEWEWKRVILKNFCNRTGVDYDRFIRYVTGKYWLHIQQALIASKRV